MNSNTRHFFWTIALAAIVGGSLTFTTRQAFSAWSMGEPMVFYWGSTGATDYKFQMTADGGYNIFRTWDNPNVPVGDVAAMESYGLRALITSEALLLPDAGALDDPVKLAKLNALIDAYKECPNAYAYRVCDEPSADDFPYLARMVAHIRQRDPDHLAYINLFGYTENTANLGVADYETYIQQYIDTVQPSVLSYDYYGLTDGYGDKLMHLKSLGIVANAAKEAGIPFINVVQNCAWANYLRKPTANETRFLTTSTLAYGAQGIGYFNYYTDDPDGGGVYDRVAEEPTDVYHWTTPMNEEFKNVASQTKEWNYIGTYLRGYDSLPPGTTQLPMTGTPFNINLDNTMSYVDYAPLKGALFGFFDTEGGTEMADATFAYIANLDYSAAKTYTLTGPGDLSVFDAATGAWTATGSDQITLNLEEGGGALVGLTSALTQPTLELVDNGSPEAGLHSYTLTATGSGITTLGQFTIDGQAYQVFDEEGNPSEWLGDGSASASEQSDSYVIFGDLRLPDLGGKIWPGPGDPPDKVTEEDIDGEGNSGVGTLNNFDDSVIPTWDDYLELGTPSSEEETVELMQLVVPYGETLSITLTLLTSTDHDPVTGESIVTSHDLSFSLYSCGLGDANGDGYVDADDVAILAAHWRQSGDWGGGDFNGDGVIDEVDATLLACNWNPQTTDVPEPSTLILLLLGGSSLLAVLARRILTTEHAEQKILRNEVIPRSKRSCSVNLLIE